MATEPQISLETITREVEDLEIHFLKTICA